MGLEGVWSVWVAIFFKGKGACNQIGASDLPYKIYMDAIILFQPFVCFGLIRGYNPISVGSPEVLFGVNH